MRSLGILIRANGYIVETILISLILALTALISFAPWENINGYTAFNGSVVVTFILLTIVFTIISFFTSRIVSALFILFIAAVIRFASDKKQLLTGEPLAFSDISQINHLGVAVKYAPYWVIIIISAIMLLFFASSLIF